MAIDLFSPPYRASHRPIDPVELLCGTIVVKNLEKSRAFYEDMLGLECAVISPRRMLVRTKESLQAKEAVRRKWVIDVREADEIVNPQRVLHHWGVDVASKEAVNQMHDRLVANKERYALRTVFDATFQHGSYAFYFQDLDSNWWEFQFAPPKQQHRVVMDRGDAV